MHTLKWYNQTKNFNENFSTWFRATQIKECGAIGVVARREKLKINITVLVHIQAVSCSYHVYSESMCTYCTFDLFRHGRKPTFDGSAFHSMRK